LGDAGAVGRCRYHAPFAKEMIQASVDYLSMGAPAV
jgi:hypothetical protein